MTLDLRFRTQHILRCFRLWAELKDDLQLAADIDHSSLLPRLLEGDEVYAEPPPRAYSYPDYDFCEGHTYWLYHEPPHFMKEDWKAADHETATIVGIKQGLWNVESRDDKGLSLRWLKTSWCGRLEKTEQGHWRFTMTSGPGPMKVKSEKETG